MSFDAKNHAAVTVVCDPNDYNRVLEGLSDEKVLPDLRRALALKVFKNLKNDKLKNINKSI